MLVFNSPVLACEPIIPLAMIFGIPFYSLFLITILKVTLFAWFERSIPIYKSILFIVIANIFSSLIGIALVLGVTEPYLLLVSLAIVYLISITPSKRLVDLNPWGVFRNSDSKALKILLPVIIFGLYFSTIVLFWIAQAMLWDRLLFLYWLLKYVYIFVALIISIGLTTLWEEWVIFKLSKGNFLPNVLKVNLLSISIVMACLALMALPERLQSGNFLLFY